MPLDDRHSRRTGRLMPRGAARHGAGRYAETRLVQALIAGAAFLAWLIIGLLVAEPAGAENYVLDTIASERPFTLPASNAHAQGARTGGSISFAGEF